MSTATIAVIDTSVLASWILANVLLLFLVIILA